VRRKSNSRIGQTSIMFTLGLTMMFGMVGLVSDVGYAYYRKEVAQAAAQSAATAAVRAAIAQSGGTCGSSNVVCQSETVCPSTISGTGSNNVEKGCLYAMANGFTSTGNQKVTIQTGTGSYNGITVTYWAVVKVSESLPQLFSRVTGHDKATLTARSIVGYIPATNGGCVYVTAPTGAALTTNGNVSMSSGCGIQVNSSSSNAIDLSGGNTSITVTGSSNGVANQVLEVGGYDCYGQTTGCISPTPTHSVSAGDPMSGIDAVADPGTCTWTDPGHYGNSSNPTIVPWTSGVTKVCGMVSPGNNDRVQFTAGGTYYFQDGLNINNGDLIGNGVTFYFPAGSSVSISGNGNISLSAPSSGTYQGVLMFQSRDNLTTAQVVGNGSSRFNGVLYFPNATLKFGGNGSAVNNSGTTSVVAYNLMLTGNSSYIQGPSSSPYLNTYTGYAVIE
jgi:Putative Flp pilus-assembly TadE/G-like